MRVAIAALLLSSVLIPTAEGVPPATVSYQGVLRDVMGNPVPDGAYSLTFALYDSPSAESRLWSETQNLDVSGGIINATLGVVEPLSLPFDITYWLGISVEDEPELAPRSELTAVPYAFRAVVAEWAEASPVQADGDWVIDEDDMYSAVPGNIGIGTATPEEALHVSGSVRANRLIPESAVAVVKPADDGRLRIGGGSDFSFTADGIRGSGVELRGCDFGGADAGGDLALYALNGKKTYFRHVSRNGSVTLRMVIDSNGNVGVGTGEPAQRLDVNGAVRANTFYGDGSNLSGISGTTDNDWTIDEPNVYRASGNVGIGTAAPGSKLHVAGGSIEISHGESAPSLVIADSEDGDYFELRHHRSADHLEIDSGAMDHIVTATKQGNVGVGTAAPEHRLQVDGKSQFNASPTSSWVVNVRNTSDTGSTLGLYATTDSPDTEAAVKGVAWAGSGNTTGVLGVTDSPGTYDSVGDPAGVYGWAHATGDGDAYGVLGRCWTSLAPTRVEGWDAPAGVFGWADVGAGLCWGVWGENSSATNTTAGVRGLSVDDTHLVYGVEGETKSSAGLGVHAIGGVGAAGIVGIEVEVEDELSYMYAVASTENWFEDFGSGVVQNGRASVVLDSRFLQVVDLSAPENMKVFLTPTSDTFTGQLAVQKSDRGFEVVETGDGRSSGTFDYRVVARRLGYEGIRMEPVTASRPDLRHARGGPLNHGHRTDRPKGTSE